LIPDLIDHLTGLEKGANASELAISILAGASP
jgi:hypothetical protein